jgi:hypothetical protein
VDVLRVQLARIDGGVGSITTGDIRDGRVSADRGGIAAVNVTGGATAGYSGGETSARRGWAGGLGPSLTGDGLPPNVSGTGRGTLAADRGGIAAARIDAVTQYNVQPARPSGSAVVAAEKVVVGDLPGEPPGFVDRAELADLARLLEQRGRVVVCAGGRGVGKSALAAAYARAALADPAGPSVVVWLPGESESVLVTGLTVLAARANLTVDGEDGQQTAGRARDYLSGLGMPALLVVDNAEHPDQIRRWLPAGGGCRTVLTSTDQAFTALAAPVQVGIYSRDQSITYLVDRTGLDDRDGAARVADALGDLPLALAQAASVISAQHLSYRRYLAKLVDRPLRAALPADPGYPRGLAEATRLSVDTATGRHPKVSTCLDVLSYLDPNGVTRTLLASILAALPADTPTGEERPVGYRTIDVVNVDEIDDVIAALAGGSLVTITADQAGVVMHRLIGRALREAHTIVWRENVVLPA